MLGIVLPTPATAGGSELPADGHACGAACCSPALSRGTGCKPWAALSVMVALVWVADGGCALTPQAFHFICVHRKDQPLLQP